MVLNLPSYTKNTTHFLNRFSSFNNIPDNVLFVTLDIFPLYTNIPYSEGIDACREALEKCEHCSPPIKVICNLLRMILTINTFEFNSCYYRQLHGTAMGTRVVPSYANLFMGSLDQKFLNKVPHKAGGVTSTTSP